MCVNMNFVIGVCVCVCVCVQVHLERSSDSSMTVYPASSPSQVVVCHAVHYHSASHFLGFYTYSSFICTKQFSARC